MDWDSLGLLPVVDAHVHFNRFDLMKPAARALIGQNPGFAEMERLVADPALIPDFLDEEGIQEAWAINYCARDVMGYGWEVNEWAAGLADATGGRVRSTGGYDPRHDGDGSDAAARIEGLGLIGAKLHPVHQGFSPDMHRDGSAEGERLRSFYAEMEARGLPVWFHTGTSIFPGADNAFQHVAPMETVAKDFPRLQVVLCHGGRPHECQEALRILERNLNAWIDVSSLPPRRIPEWFAGFEAVQDRILWGSDWPGPKVPGMGENVFLFLSLGVPEPTAKMILYENASRLRSAAGATTGP